MLHKPKQGKLFQVILTVKCVVEGFNTRLRESGLSGDGRVTAWLDYGYGMLFASLAPSAPQNSRYIMHLDNRLNPTLPRGLLTRQQTQD
jgi:hypothetical protein